MAWFGVECQSPRARPKPQIDKDAFKERPAHRPPPPHGEKLTIDMRVDLDHCSDVDTVRGTVHIKIKVALYWTDPRLEGWPDDRDLPKTLWGPKLNLDNAANYQWKDESVFFALSDRKKGRLKRVRVISGTIINSMNLQDFPFDVDAIEIMLSSTSSWKSLDGTLHNDEVGEKIYQLRAINGGILEPKEVKNMPEGQFLKMCWDGQLAEWDLHGLSWNIVENERCPEGYETTDVRIHLHVARKASHYVQQVLVPMYLLVGLAFTTFSFGTKDLEHRNSANLTCFLACFAMLYVVESSLPKTHYLTKIDQAILLSTLMLGMIGGVCRLLYCMHEAWGVAWQPRAVMLDWIAQPVLLVGYIVLQVNIFWPAIERQREAKRMLQGKHIRPQDDRSRRRWKKAFPPTLEKGFKYTPIKRIPGYQQEGQEENTKRKDFCCCLV